MQTTRTICDLELQLAEHGNYIATLVGDVELEVEYEYEAGDPGVYTYPNGDPGYPGHDSTVHVGKCKAAKECTFYGEQMKLVIEAGADIKDMLTLRQIDDMAEQILEDYEQECEDRKADAEIARYEYDREFS